MKVLGKLINWLDLYSFHFVFKSRTSAGQILGKNLIPIIENANQDNQLTNRNIILVIGIANGGIVVAKEIAKSLGCELAVIAPIRISDKNNCENTLGAILHIPHPCNLTGLVKDESGNSYCMTAKKESDLILDEPYKSELFKRALQKSNTYAEYASNSIAGRIVILADDGVFSGATASVSLTWIRYQNPSRLIFASPVAPFEFYESVINSDTIGVNHIEILKKMSSSEVRNSVSEYYENFEQIKERNVKQLMDSYR